MDEHEYLRESVTTLSNSYHKEICPASELNAMLHGAQAAIDWADRCKKGLFYGKEFKHLSAPGNSHSLTLPDNPDLLHAILGVFTEAGELLEHYGKVLRGEVQLDLVNLQEEVGDLLWYCAIIWRATGSTPSESMRRNISKLQARFPDKFTEAAAKQRNLVFEREVLIQGV